MLAIMTDSSESPFSQRRARLREEAYRIGYLEGSTKVLIRLLDARGITMRTADRDYMMTFASLDSLDKWEERAWTATTIGELFED